MKLSDSEILFCDQHLLIALKPSGLYTQPPPQGGDSLEEFAKAWVKKQYNKPGRVFLHAIHRLDKPVSGLVLFARTSKALSRLNEQQRNLEIQRVYIAEVEGILPFKEGVLDHFLAHKSHKACICSKEDEGAKQARLTYQVLEFRQGSSIVEIELETGRYHQIRAQFSAIGHPVQGDTRYGGKEGAKESIHLHCMQIALKHPVTKEVLSFRSPSPFFI